MHILLLVAFVGSSGASGSGGGGGASSIVYGSSNSTSTSEWKMYGRTLDNNRFYPATVNLTDFGYLWQKSFSTQRIIGVSPIISNNLVIMGSSDQFYHALNDTTGVEIWNFATISIISTAAEAEGIVYMPGSSGSNIISAGSITNGSQIWTAGIRIGAESSPLVSNGIVYEGADDGLYALNITNGAQIWHAAISGGLDVVTSSPALVDDIVYVGSQDDNLYALNASTGSHIWNFTTGDSIDSSPAIASDVVFIGSQDNSFYALNASTGSHIWNFTTGGQIRASPAIANDVVFIGSQDNSFYALNASTGSHIWNFTTGSWTTSPIIADGIVYVYGGTRIFAFSAGNPNPPIISLNNPPDAYINASRNITFSWRVTDIGENSSICGIIINGTTNGSDIIVANGTFYLYNTSLFNEGWYNWSVACTDGRNNSGISDVRTFAIVEAQDTTPPIIKLTINNTSPRVDDIINISANITDDFGLLSANITYNRSGFLTKVNFTITGKSANITNVTAVSTSGGSVINITIYATDTSNNVRQNSILITITEVDQEPDTVFPAVKFGTNISIDNIKMYYAVNISCNATDNAGLKFINLTYNMGSIVKLNDSISGISFVFYSIVNIAVGGTINFTCYTIDTSNNLAQNYTSIIIADTIPPTLNVSINYTSSRDNYLINISANITDETELLSANITYNISGALTKINFTLSGNVGVIRNITK